MLRVTSIAHLAQTVVNQLMTTPGSDRLSPTRGAGLSDLCRRHRTNSQKLQEKIGERIEKVNMQMQDEQRQLDLSPQERLESITLISATPDPDKPTRLNIVIGVRSQAGEQAQIVI